MRHRLANKSLSRPTAHRMLMLRNLVSSLLAHQSITTTLTKAKETQKLAEKVIGWGKKGGKSNYDRASAWLLNPNETMSPLFTTFAARYATRPGGYTRIHRVGHRVGDNAPLAVLELIDSPNDLKFESTARIVGREMAIRAREGAGMEGWWKFRERVVGSFNSSSVGNGVEGEEGVIKRIGEAIELDGLTRKNCVKVLRYRVEQFSIESNLLSLETETNSTSTIEEPLESNSDSTPTSSSLPIISPTHSFLDLIHSHYLRSLATLSLSPNSSIITPTSDPFKNLKQLTARLNPTDEKGPPKKVYTLPTLNRIMKAGERTDGWGDEMMESLTEEEIELNRKEKRGGPIGRAKGSRGREARREVWTGTKRSEEALAGGEL